MNMKAFKRVIVVWVAVALLGVCVHGCSTVKGAGRDVQSVGRGMERASDNVQK